MVAPQYTRRGWRGRMAVCRARWRLVARIRPVLHCGISSVETKAEVREGVQQYSGEALPRDLGCGRCVYCCVQQSRVKKISSANVNGARPLGVGMCSRCSCTCGLLVVSAQCLAHNNRSTMVALAAPHELQHRRNAGPFLYLCYRVCGCRL